MHIRELLDAKIASERSERKEKNGFWVTDLSRCLRGVLIERREGRAELEERKLRIFKAGSLFEDFVVGTVPEDRIIATQERVEWPEYNLSGRCDLIVKDDDGAPLLFEIKSQHSDAFHWMEKRGGANEAHVQQVSLYWSKLKDKYPGLKAFVVYVSKDDLCIAQYPVFPDEEKIAGALAGAAELKKHWDAGSLPEPIETVVYDADKGYNVVNWKAKYCDVHDRCLNNPLWLNEAEDACRDKNGGALRPRKKKAALQPAAA